LDGFSIDIGWTAPLIDLEADHDERSAILTGRTSERTARFCAPGGDSSTLGGAMRAMGGGDGGAPSCRHRLPASAPPRCSASAPPGSALRPGRWSRFGNEGGEPGGSGGLVRARLANLPGFLSESASDPGQLANWAGLAAETAADPAQFAN
jgi:hypothetical protein